MPDQPWTAARLVAIDLEGTGGQDRDREAILEIAIVPLVAGRPDMCTAWESVINPGRGVTPHHWISPGLSGNALTGAPRLDDIRAEVAKRLHRKFLIGHNVGVDWRLLRRHLPEVQPAGLIDTGRLFRHLLPGTRRWKLTVLLEQYGLHRQVHALVPLGQPHRALWDAVAAALLLRALISDLPDGHLTTMAQLATIAGFPTHEAQPADSGQVALDF